MTAYTGQNAADAPGRPVKVLLLLIGCLAVPACTEAPEKRWERDLLTELKWAREVREKSVLDVGTAAARAWLRGTWSYDEITPATAAFAGDRTFAWAVGDRSEVVFALVDVRPIQITLGLRPFLYPGSGPLPLELDLNGNRLDELSLDGDAQVRLDLPAEWLVEGENRLALLPGRFRAVSEALPGSADSRQLTIALFHLLLDGASLPGALPDADPMARHPDGGPPSAELDGMSMFQWALRVPAGSSLRYDLALTGQPPGLVGLEWHPDGGDPELLVREELSVGWLGRSRIADTLPLPGGNGTLRLRLSPSGPSEPSPRVRLRRLELLIPPPPRPQNVILITLDTFRADHLAAYGHPSIRTPVLDRLARQSVTLAGFHSHIPITGPAHSALFTGRFPITTGVRNNGYRVPQSEETLAEVLHSYGWSTVGVISLVVLHSNFRFGKGFEHFEQSLQIPWRPAGEVTEQALQEAGRADPERPLFLWAHYSDPHEPYAPPTLQGASIELFRDEQSLEQINVSGCEPGYMKLTLPPGSTRLTLRRRGNWTEPFLGARVRYITLSEPGLLTKFQDGFVGPNDNGFYDLVADEGSLELVNPNEQSVETVLTLLAQERLTVEESLVRYALEVEYLDQELGRLLAGLQEQGRLDDDTILIIVNDHGEGLWAHGQPGHVEQLYAESVHSPFFLRAPGLLRPALRSAPGQQVDLLPTLLDLMELPAKKDVQGHSLLSVLRGNSSTWPSESNESAGELFLQTFAPEATSDVRSLIRGRYKLIVTADVGQRELYDLWADPGEVYDRSAAKPALVEAMVERLAELEGLGFVGSAELAGPDELTQEQLRALGYLR